ncbi:hypothetical protein, partial [Xanthomonas codiaei]
LRMPNNWQTPLSSTLDSKPGRYSGRGGVVGKKSSHLAVWRMVELLRPVHFLLDDMGQLAHQKEAEKGESLPLVPHFEDFFWFLLANRSDIIKRKSSWLRLFNS